MCAVPGGINDTPIVAAAMGANAPDVTIMQLIRQVLGIGVFPIMIEAFDRLRTRQGHPDPGDAKPGEGAKRVKSKQKSVASTVAALAVAVIAGALGKASGIPRSHLHGLHRGCVRPEARLRLRIHPEGREEGLSAPRRVLLGNVAHRRGVRGASQPHRARAHPYRGYTLNCFAAGKLESKLFGYGRREGMLMASPAGASDMALIMEDLHVKNTDVVIMQVVRAAVVMALFLKSSTSSASSSETRKRRKLMKRVAVNGMGRIGRLVVRSLIGCEDVELVAVNDIASMETIAYLLAHSTEYGALGISVSFDEDMGILHVGDKVVKAFREPDALKLPWDELGIDFGARM